MKIAITSPNTKSISGHAGKCPGYWLYDLKNDGQIDKAHIKLSKAEVFKNVAGLLSENPTHPLTGIEVFVTQSIGDGLLKRLEKDHINVIQTQETDPDLVIQRLIK